MSTLSKVTEGTKLGIQTQDHSTPKLELLAHPDAHRETGRTLLHATIRTKQKMLSPKEWERVWFISFYS